MPQCHPNIQFTAVQPMVSIYDGLTFAMVLKSRPLANPAMAGPISSFDGTDFTNLIILAWKLHSEHDRRNFDQRAVKQ
jgi:hypothetical protein